MRVLEREDGCPDQCEICGYGEILMRMSHHVSVGPAHVNDAVSRRRYMEIEDLQIGHLRAFCS